MRKILIPFIMLMMVMLMGSCKSSKNVTYFRNIDSISLAGSRGLYDARIMPKDELTITVITTNPDASAPFNLSVGHVLGTGGELGGTGALQAYLVDNDGNINFPIIGKLYVIGKTKTECENMIREKIKPYLNERENPIVTVRMSSYRVTIIGEVNGPRVVPVTTEKMSIVEALASVGDMGIFGKRNNILLIREDANGEKHAIRMNMNDANIFNSPYYYLQQNDIIYVEPRTTKARNLMFQSNTSLIFTLIGVASSITSLVYTLTR